MRKFSEILNESELDDDVDVFEDETLEEDGMLLEKKHKKNRNKGGHKGGAKGGKKPQGGQGGQGGQSGQSGQGGQGGQSGQSGQGGQSGQSGQGGGTPKPNEPKEEKHTYTDENGNEITVIKKTDKDGKVTYTKKDKDGKETEATETDFNTAKSKSSAGKNEPKEEKVEYKDDDGNTITVIKKTDKDGKVTYTKKDKDGKETEATEDDFKTAQSKAKPAKKPKQDDPDAIPTNILNNPITNPNGLTEEQIKKWRKQQSDKEVKDAGKSGGVDAMDWQKSIQALPMVALTFMAIFNPIGALLMGGLFMFPALVANTTMALSKIKSEHSDEIDDDDFEKFLKGCEEGVENSGLSEEEQKKLKEGVTDVRNSTIKDGQVQTPEQINKNLENTATGKAIKATAETVEKLRSGKIKVDEAQEQVKLTELKAAKDRELEEAGDDEKKKKEIEEKYKDKIAFQEEAVEAAQNGEKLEMHEVEDKEGKKIKAAIHVGPRGGRYYYPQGAPHDEDHRQYIAKESRTYSDLAQFLTEGASMSTSSDLARFLARM